MFQKRRKKGKENLWMLGPSMDQVEPTASEFLSQRPHEGSLSSFMKETEIISVGINSYKQQNPNKI